MGRRLLVILGILLAVSASAPFAHGQDEGQNRPPAAPVPAEPSGSRSISRRS